MINLLKKKMLIFKEIIWMIMLFLWELMVLALLGSMLEVKGLG